MSTTMYTSAFSRWYTKRPLPLRLFTQLFLFTKHIMLSLSIMACLHCRPKPWTNSKALAASSLVARIVMKSMKAIPGPTILRCSSVEVVPTLTLCLMMGSISHTRLVRWATLPARVVLQVASVAHLVQITKSNTGTTGATSVGDTQTPQQGKDPSLVEEKTSSNWKGEGTDGSHSAVFGLTPDGHKHDDTAHGAGSLRPAHSKSANNTDTATGDTGSRAAAGGQVADQMHDPRVAEKAHGGPDLSSTDTNKPGAGGPPGAGEQGFGKVRPGEHGTEEKVANKLDPTTDADGDGKRGAFD